MNAPSYFKKILEKANKWASAAKRTAEKIQVADQRNVFDGESARLRWMVLPIEAKEALSSKSTRNNMDQVVAPFKPKMFLKLTTDRHNLLSDVDRKESNLPAGSLLSSTNLRVSEEYLAIKFS